MSKATGHNNFNHTQLSEFLQVTEVDNAELFITALFQRKFHCLPPDFQRHFIAFYKPDPKSSQVIPVGYVHQTPYLDCYLCGGLVIDDRIYRTMPNKQRQIIRQTGGIAELLLLYSFSKLTDTKAIWGYVGDTKAEKVDLRVGFVHTTIKPIMVCWKQDLSQQEKDALLEQILAIGPF
ncbi:MAG: hypothetical protein V3V22_06345 [Methylococcales bacterium]